MSTELTTRELKIMFALAIGVIIVLLFFVFRPHDTVPDDSKARAREDSLKRANVNLGLALEMSNKREAYLKKRDVAWGDTLTKERIRNKASATKILKRPVPQKLTSQESDSILSARYHVGVHVTPAEAGSIIVADLDILDKALAFLPQVEQEIEHLNQRLEVKDSLGVEHAKQDSIREAQTNNVSVQLTDKTQANDALKKENKTLKRKVNVLKKVAKNILIGTAVTLGIIIVALKP